MTKNAGGGRNEPIASQVMYYSVIQKTFLSNALAAMKSTVTVRLDDDLDRELSEVSDALGRSRSEIVRDALRRQLSVLRFEELRKQVMPFAEARGYLTDEDVFEEVS